MRLMTRRDSSMVRKNFRRWILVASPQRLALIRNGFAAAARRMSGLRAAAAAAAHGDREDDGEEDYEDYGDEECEDDITPS